MAKTWYGIIITLEGQQIKRKINATNAKKAAQTAAAEFGLTLTGKAPSTETDTQWHAVRDDGTTAVVAAFR